MAKSMQRTASKEYDEAQIAYEEREEMLSEIQNQDGDFFTMLASPKVAGMIFALTLFICFCGVVSRFLNFGKENEQQVVVQPPPVTQPAPTQPKPPAPDEKQLAKEEEQEMNSLRENFKPFEGASTEPQPQSQPQLPSMNPVQPPVVETPPIVETPEITPEPTTPEPAYVPPVEHSRPHESRPYNPNNPTYPGDKKDKDGEGPVFKGTAQDGGVVFCYISVNGSTSRYSEGDSVDGQTIVSIGNNYAVLMDEAGNRSIIAN